MTTTDKPCLPECYTTAGRFAPRQTYHATGCPNAPKPAEPQQGSEESIEPVTELEAEKSTSKILRDLLAKAEAERDDARATKDMHKERQEEAWAEVVALRAENEKLKQLDIRPSTGSDLPWVDGKHRCAATISNNHLWQVEDEAESLRAELAAADQNLKTMLQAAGEEAERQLATKDKELAAAREEITIANGQLSEAVEAAAIGEAVMDAVQGKPVSDFFESFGPVRDAQDMHDAINGLTANLAAEKDRADRAEAWVNDAEGYIRAFSPQSGWLETLAKQAKEILAARPRKEEVGR